jgi:hypothetical protein
MLLMLQALQLPQLVTLQQTPSVQCPVEQCRSLLQVAPGPESPTHVPPLQKYPLAHCPSTVQLLGQPPEVQLYGVQSCDPCAGQLPVPEHETCGLKIVPEQLDAVQTVLLDVCWQAPLTHVPVLPQVPFGLQPPWGSRLPSVTAAQVPRPLTLQAWQVPQLLALQQTPSVHMPLLHSWFAPQVPLAALSVAQTPGFPGLPVQ